MGFWFFIGERTRNWEFQGVNKVGKSCFSEQIRRAEERVVLLFMPSFETEREM